MFIHEEIKTKVIKEYDVAVCGGGIAGISAALAAARQGRKTVLFERELSMFDITKLQDVLRNDGVVLHENEIL